MSVLILTMAVVATIIIAFGRDKSSTAINFANNLVAGDKISIPENPNWQNELSDVSKNTTQVQTEGTSQTEETATDIVSRSLISNYLALKENGLLNQTSAQKLVDQTLTLTDQLGGDVILDTKLNIVADNGVQSIIDYGNNLGNILKKYSSQPIKNELEIITQAVESRDPSKTNELDSIIITYEQIASDLSKMPVPQTFVKAHLDMTNGLKVMAISLTEIKTVFSDPIKSLSSLQLYQEGRTRLSQAIKANIIFIKSQNKNIYKQGSGGYYLLYRI